ncbi:MAG: thiamine phosphate synthase [Bacteroidales bacterium]|nr:thiamine phosphate synthase [Bacteroidales bacterium]
MMKINNIESFQYITNQWSALSIIDQTEIVCSRGCKWVQLRIKDTNIEEWKDMALSVKSICKKYNAKFIINDNVQLAKEVEADGVHLGMNDLSPELAREILGSDAIIGGTANNFDQIQTLYKQKVDYIGLGPFRFTSTKKNLALILGIEGYKEIIKECENYNINIPIIGIGGITPNDISLILETGVYGIAASSIICNSSSPVEITNEIINKIKSYINATIKNSR